MTCKPVACASIAALLWLNAPCLPGPKKTMDPVTPRASAEARALLKLIYSISGRYTLTGQHNYPNVKSRNTEFATWVIGKTPAVYSQDWGFAKDGDTDSYLARPDIVEEAKKQHQAGSLVTLCWHAVPPTADEPVTFRPERGGVQPGKLASVQGQLTDEQFKDVLTPGTDLYKRWCAQVDAIAGFFKRLQEARVPVLWRPYHEMNGNWFWWGGRLGRYGTAALYRQLFDRMVKHHKLDNLIWVWSMDRPNRPEMVFSNFFPGKEVVDILSLDVYGGDFSPSYYDSLAALSDGKPLVLGEVGNPPTPEILANQPRWAYYVIWAGMVRNTPKKQHLALLNDPRVLCLEDPGYREAVAPFRKACGLPAMQEKPVPTGDSGKKTDFSGKWIFNEDKSAMDNMGAGLLPFRLGILQKDNGIIIERRYLQEFADDRILEQTLSLDGKECKSVFMDSPQVSTANWSATGDSLTIDTKATITRGDRSFDMVQKEVWTLHEQGKILSIHYISNFGRGERNVTLIFDRQ